MCRSLRRRVAAPLAAALVTTTLLAAPAWADGVPSGSGQTTSDQGVSHTGNQYAPQVIVTVTSDGVRETSTVVSAPLTTETHPPCWMEPSWAGPDLFNFYDSGEAYRLAHHTGDPRPVPPADYADHKAEGPDKGMYWSGMCSSAYWDGDLASFFAYSDQFFATHPTQWVPAGAPDPNTDIAIPPEALMHIARGLLDLGAPPDLEVNPTGNSVVNLPTWVWATDGSFMEHRVRAEFNGNWAEVIAEPVGLEIHADGPHELHGDCAGGGTVYRPGATTNCSVTFLKSSAGAGEYHITATIVWQVHWEGSGGQNQPLDPPASPGLGTRAVQVDEVQTVLENNVSPAASR